MLWKRPRFNWTLPTEASHFKTFQPIWILNTKWSVERPHKTSSNIVTITWISINFFCYCCSVCYDFTKGVPGKIDYLNHQYYSLVKRLNHIHCFILLIQNVVFNLNLRNFNEKWKIIFRNTTVSALFYSVYRILIGLNMKISLYFAPAEIWFVSAADLLTKRLYCLQL